MKMKIRGAHIGLFVAAAVVGLLIYGGVRMTGNVAETKPDDDQFLQEIREIAPTVPSTEEGTVPPMGKAGETPKIELEPSGDIDMGTVRNDADTTMEVKVHNKGKAPLKIAKIGIECGCTAGSMKEEDKTIAPGGSSPLTITVKPARIATGFESHKFITLFSNDPATPALKIRVNVKIDPEYLIEPAKLEFGTVEKGKPQEKVILLRQLTDQPIEIKSISGAMPKWKSLEITHELRPKEQWLDTNKPEYNIKVKLADDIPLGPYSGRFNIETTFKRRSQISVSVIATITSWYAKSPDRGLILSQSAGEKATITADRPFEITDILPSVEGIIADVQPGENEKSKVISLRLDPAVNVRTKIEYVNFTLKSGEEALKEQLEVRIIPTAAPAASAPKPE